MEALPNCILCNQPLSPLSQGPAVEPFWLRYTDFLRLPFSVTGLAVLFLLLAVPVIAPVSALPPVGVAGYFAAALLGWAVLRRTSAGSVAFPGIAELGQLLAAPAVPAALLLTVLMAALGYGAQYMPFLSFLAALVLAGLLPAALMLAAMEKSVSGLRSRSSWQAVFAAMRFLYVPAGGAAVLLFVFLQAIVSLLADVATPGMTQGLRNALYAYGIWAIAGLSGYSLYQFGEALGFRGDGTRAKTRKSAIRRLDANTARIEVLLKEGMYDKAASVLQGLANKQRNAVDIQERYFSLLVFLKDKQGVAHQGESYIAALIAAGQKEQALVVLSKILLVMPDFRPEDAAVTYDLARTCVEFREFARAAALLDGLHQTSPHFPQLPEAYMLRAKLQHEKLGQSAQALEVMDFLVARFQKHPRYEAMRSYWKQLGGRDPGTDFMVGGGD